MKQFNLRIGNRYALAWTGHEELDAWLSCADGFPFPIIHPSGPSGNLTIDAATEPGPFCAYIPEAEVVGTPRLLPLMPDDDLSLTGGGRKSISETLREAGVPPLLRPHVAGVRDDNRLLWIPGIRGLASLESQPAPGLIALSWRQKISP